MADEENPDVTIQEEKYSSSNVCDVCLNDNLLKQVGINRCEKCKHAFCIHYTSTFDPTYCVDCMSDISVTKENVSKVYEHYNEATDSVVRYSRRAKQIKIEGQDWLFAQRKIKTLSDVELDMVIEYHRTMCQLLLAESEERKAAKMHRYAGVRIMPSTSATVTVVKETKKSTEVKGDKAKAKFAALMQSMLSNGMSLDQIAEMLKGK